MNKKEVAEIKKTLKMEKCCIDKIIGCYVTPSKDKRMITLPEIRTMEEEHLDKYLEIFKKSLSGSIGKQLNCITFPDDAEDDGGTQNLLNEIEKSGLDDDERIEELFDRIVNNYEDKGYYCILLMHALYDVPSKDSDSEDVYSHMVCSVCPVTVTKPFLSYIMETNEIQDGPVAWMVGNPQCAFLFPTFTDRMSNIHEVMVYNKKASEVNTGIIEGVLQCNIPASADEQVNAFVTSTQAAFDNAISYEQAASIHDALTEQMESAESAESEVVVTSAAIKNILENENASNLDAFDTQFNSMIGDNEVFLANLVDKDKFVVKMDGLVIAANNDTKDLISVQEVDGHKCLVISPNGDMEVNGIVTKIG